MLEFQNRLIMNFLKFLPDSCQRGNDVIWLPGGFGSFLAEISGREKL